MSWAGVGVSLPNVLLLFGSSFTVDGLLLDLPNDHCRGEQEYWI